MSPVTPFSYLAFCGGWGSSELALAVSTQGTMQSQGPHTCKACDSNPLCHLPGPNPLLKDERGSLDKSKYSGVGHLYATGPGSITNTPSGPPNLSE